MVLPLVRLKVSCFRLGRATSQAGLGHAGFDWCDDYGYGSWCTFWRFLDCIFCFTETSLVCLHSSNNKIQVAAKTSLDVCPGPMRTASCMHLGFYRSGEKNKNKSPRCLHTYASSLQPGSRHVLQGVHDGVGELSSRSDSHDASETSVHMERNSCCLLRCRDNM